MYLPKNKILFYIVILTLVFGFTLATFSFVGANDIDDELEEVEDEIKETRDEINDLTKKVDNIKNEVKNLSGSLSEILASINSLQADITDLNSQITKVNITLNKNTVLLTGQTVVRDRTLRSFYKKSPTNLMVSVIQSNSLFAEDNTSEYLKKYIDESVTFISEINSEIIINKENKKLLEELKKELEVQQQKLLVIKKDTEEKLKKQEAELALKNNDLSSLNEKLGSLLEKQQQIIAVKNGDFNASLNESQTDDPKSSPSYNPGFSPAFAAFSYGAYTHRNGMSQWGAKGRADAGQNYEEILDFYFPDKELTDDFDTPNKIRVVGDGISCNGGSKYYNEEVDFETYIKRIYEVYGSWPDDVLKAQAILARTYAIRIINVHGSIKPNQSHQVYKDCNKGGAWDKAVEDTEGEVLVKNGAINFLAEYSSTTGGYINGIGWDVDGSWPNDAYEKKAGSPWFYKAWYTKGTSISSDKCGRDHPWLNDKEMADVLNAYIVLKSGGDTSGISPLTTSCWGGNPWSMGELRGKAGKDISSASGVSDFKFNSGKTVSFKVQTNKGTFEVSDAQTFRAAFNLRAPGYIAIKSVLFDLRKK